MAIHSDLKPGCTYRAKFNIAVYNIWFSSRNLNIFDQMYAIPKNQTFRVLERLPDNEHVNYKIEVSGMVKYLSTYKDCDEFVELVLTNEQIKELIANLEWC